MRNYIIFILLATAFYFYTQERQVREPFISGNFELVSVADGDTVTLRDSAGVKVKVRMIGIDTSETEKDNQAGECYSQEAKKFLESQFNKDSKIELEIDGYKEDEYDKYDRLLAYLIIDGVNINGLLIEQGYGEEYTYNREKYTYQDQFKQYEKDAKSSNLGLWGECK